MRRRGINTPEVPQGPSLWKKIWNSLFCYFCVVWKFILFLWYWVQRIFLIVFLIILTVWLAWWISQKPSNLRDWNLAESTLPNISFSGREVTIQNVRNHKWITDKDFVPGYYDELYDLDKIESLYYMIVPFSNFDGPAHTMLSFGFSDGKKLVISAEVRKERGESFAALAWLFNQFEIMYVLGSEEDIIKLRTNYRKNSVYMYPIATPKEKIRDLFQSMLIRADKLAKEPEFYNTLWNNCTTSILMHANALRNDKISWTLEALLPAHSDDIIYNLGLIDTKLALSEARQYYKIDELARESTASGLIFSDVIRKVRK